MRCSLLLRALTPRAALKVLDLPLSTQLTQATIKKAYIQQALRCHPDLNPTDPKANENFQTLSEALRVALQALELTGAGGSGQGTGRQRSSETYDSQAALESLRRSILAYRAYRDAHVRRQAGVSPDPDDAAGTDSSSSAAGSHPRVETDSGADLFFSPSLEYVSSVCQEETVAMRRVQAFCESLPSVLCGSRSAALFEAVAFFHTHYVASMAECVMRFSKNLPIIVRRVVRNRKQFVRYRSPKAARGIGTGNRPREQRIEDMAMKPLVLMGALIFDVPTHHDAPDLHGATFSREDDGRKTRTGKNSRTSSSTCGVSHPDEIEVTAELKCVIDTTDTIGSITEKLNRWEAASFDRLKLELAIVDATTLMASLVGLEEAGTALTVPPHLQLNFEETERVLLTVQKVSCDLCLFYDDHENFVVGGNEDVAAGLWLDKDAQADAEDAAAVGVPVAQLIAECRVLALEAAPLVKDSVLLTWTKDTAFVESAEEVSRVHAAPPTATTTPGVGNGSDKGGDDDNKDGGGEAPAETRRRVHVARHASCCEAETIAYAVSIELTKDVRCFLLRLRLALRTTLRDAHQSRMLLPDLLELRDKTVQEEFIPITPPRDEGGEVSGAAATGEEEGEGETAQAFRYRGPIFCFTRLHNINTARELLWWQRLFDEREYVATHAAAMNPVNVYYDCLPYDHHSAADKLRPIPPDTPGGWVGDAAADGGGDHAVLARDTLDSPATFREWLEDVVEQSSLNHEVQTELDRAGIGYITRDPTLPLTNFLSFVRVFVSATAVRGVLESSAHDDDHQAASLSQPRTPRTITAGDIGLSIIVGHECGVRDGGQLLIPWYMDPNVLLALLGEATPTPELPAQ